MVELGFGEGEKLTVSFRPGRTGQRSLLGPWIRSTALSLAESGSWSSIVNRSDLKLAGVCVQQPCL